MKKELTLEAKIENIPQFITLVDEFLESIEFSMKSQMQIDVALDEILSNIAFYAYKNMPNPGSMSLVIEGDAEGPVIITISDEGVHYNPLEAKEPDVTAGIEEREIGGLGIFMTKKLMDNVEYKFEDGKNILILTKA